MPSPEAKAIAAKPSRTDLAYKIEASPRRPSSNLLHGAWRRSRRASSHHVAHNYAAHLWIDNIIDPVETRDVMGLLLDLAARIPSPETRLGVLRM